MDDSHEFSDFYEGVHSTIEIAMTGLIAVSLIIVVCAIVYFLGDKKRDERP
ncbi:hypothetical protein [Paenibacillus sp. FSL H7-0326]|uniref:hypothetical protein n=1 Tax=Paenibacillus sp. FSL H7-0326 TaxID=1921144 RepID=UPI0015C2C9C1|nr:hypothetical protein [Paenibacillus sp. FSL H7-0326]